MIKIYAETFDLLDKITATENDISNTFEDLEFGVAALKEEINIQVNRIKKETRPVIDILTNTLSVLKPFVDQYNRLIDRIVSLKHVDGNSIQKDHSQVLESIEKTLKSKSLEISNSVREIESILKDRDIKISPDIKEKYLTPRYLQKK